MTLSTDIKNSGKTFSVKLRQSKWDLLYSGPEYAILTDYVQDYTVNTAGIVVGVEPHGH